mgnify:CR=1 FL=1
MENYFKMNLPQSEIDAISNLGLAHMGDCVFEILCRGYLCAQGEKTVGQLHHDTIQMVKATSQAKFADKLLPLLTEEELAYYRRGKTLTSMRCRNPPPPPNMQRPPVWKPCSAHCTSPGKPSG